MQVATITGMVATHRVLGRTATCHAASEPGTIGEEEGGGEAGLAAGGGMAVGSMRGPHFIGYYQPLRKRCERDRGMQHESLLVRPHR
jgi:hypothetical protein